MLFNREKQYRTHFSQEIISDGKTLFNVVLEKGHRLCKRNVRWSSGASKRLPKLATPIHWINPSYLLIKSSNHGLDPFHWFVSRHGRAEERHNALLVNPRYKTRADRLIDAWKSVLNRWKRAKGASIFPFLRNSPCHRHDTPPEVFFREIDGRCWRLESRYLEWKRPLPGTSFKITTVV